MNFLLWGKIGGVDALIDALYTCQRRAFTGNDIKPDYRGVHFDPLRCQPSKFHKPLKRPTLRGGVTWAERLLTAYFIVFQEKYSLEWKNVSSFTPPAKQGQDRLLENQINCGKHDAAGNAQQNGAANAFVGVVFSSAAQAYTDKGAATVPDHYRNGQDDHRHREHNCVSGVPVRAEIAGVGNKKLSHNVVERRHPKRDHARDRIFFSSIRQQVIFFKIIRLLIHEMFLL